MASLRLIVLTKPVEGREDEYNDWYNGRHLDDVLAIKGFRAAQRFHFAPTTTLGPEAPFEYLAIYEIDGLTAEEAEALLLETSSDREKMPISKAMAKERATWFFEAITERREESVPAAASGGATDS